MNFNPEKIILNEQKGVLENKRHLDILYNRIEKKLSSYRPDPEEFRDIYGSEVDDDFAYVEEKKKQFAEQVEGDERFEFLEKEKQIALISEGILTDQLSGTWLNSEDVDSLYSVIAHPTSDFDDIRNGADLVLEIVNKHKEEAKHLGLSIDITFSSDLGNLNKKMERIINDIKKVHKESSHVKYFESDFDGYKGSVDIARSVVVLSRETVEDLFEKEISRDKEALANHPVQLSLIAQLEEQAETFIKLCESHGNERLSSIYQDILNNIRFLKREKKVSHSDFEQDPTSLQEKYDGLRLLHRALINNIV